MTNSDQLKVPEQSWQRVMPLDPCQRDLIGNDCRCTACEERKVEAAEYAREAMEGR